MRSLNDFIDNYDLIDDEDKESLSEYIANKVLGNRQFLITFELDDDLANIVESFTDEQIRELSSWDNILEEYFTYYCEDTNQLNVKDFDMI